jgi:hypothetical protein
MQIPKDAIIDFIRSKVSPDKAGEAQEQLPDQVDTDRDAPLLERFGVDVPDLLAHFAGQGGLGDAAGKIGDFLK